MVFISVLFQKIVKPFNLIHVLFQIFPDISVNKLPEFYGTDFENFSSTNIVQTPSSLEINKRTEIDANFYVFPNPIAIFLVPYGLYLVFYAWLSPSTIPSTIPLGTIAQYLGKYTKLALEI